MLFRKRSKPPKDHTQANTSKIKRARNAADKTIEYLLLSNMVYVIVLSATNLLPDTTPYKDEITAYLAVLIKSPLHPQNQHSYTYFCIAAFLHKSVKFNIINWLLKTAYGETQEMFRFTRPSQRRLQQGRDEMAKELTQKHNAELAQRDAEHNAELAQRDAEHNAELAQRNAEHNDELNKRDAELTQWWDEVTEGGTKPPDPTIPPPSFLTNKNDPEAV